VKKIEARIVSYAINIDEPPTGLSGLGDQVLGSSNANKHLSIMSSKYTSANREGSFILADFLEVQRSCTYSVHQSDRTGPLALEKVSNKRGNAAVPCAALGNP
jgi:hypothetical protein